MKSRQEKDESMVTIRFGFQYFVLLKSSGLNYFHFCSHYTHQECLIYTFNYPSTALSSFTMMAFQQ